MAVVSPNGRVTSPSGREVISCPTCGRRITCYPNGAMPKHRWLVPARVKRGPEAGAMQPWCPGDAIQEEP